MVKTSQLLVDSILDPMEESTPMPGEFDSTFNNLDDLDNFNLYAFASIDLDGLSPVSFSFLNDEPMRPTKGEETPSINPTEHGL